MKTKAIVRIVIYSLVILILLGILMGGILAGTILRNLDINGLFWNPPFTDGIVASGGTADPAAVRNLHIDWAAGDVKIQATQQVTDLTFQLDSSSASPLTYKVQGDTLYILFQESAAGFSAFGSGCIREKDLTIFLPSDWAMDDLTINAAAARVDGLGIQADSMNFNGASGSFKFQDCQMNWLSIKTVSGSIFYQGSLKNFSSEGVSADCTLEIQGRPERIIIEGISGRLSLQLAPEVGFQASVESVSGTFRTDFETFQEHGRHVYGDGTCRINLKTVSGDVYIRKLP